MRKGMMGRSRGGEGRPGTRVMGKAVTWKMRRKKRRTWVRRQQQEHREVLLGKVLQGRDGVGVLVGLG
jgi:hypothetical protein